MIVKYKNALKLLYLSTSYVDSTTRTASTPCRAAPRRIFFRSYFPTVNGDTKTTFETIPAAFNSLTHPSLSIFRAPSKLDQLRDQSESLPLRNTPRRNGNEICGLSPSILFISSSLTTILSVVRLCSIRP